MKSRRRRPTERSDAVLVVGGQGEFGQFLRRELLPRLGAANILTVERETPRERCLASLRAARHIVLSTPLASYAERACEIVLQCRSRSSPATLWLVPSVQAGVWQAVGSMLELVGNPYLSVVCAHPMYGPNGFAAAELHAGTFRNILTAAREGEAHPLAPEIARVSRAFLRTFNIPTVTDYSPDEHDRITARSQGLSYCVAQQLFQQPELDARVAERMPELHRAFHADRELILTFLRVNEHVPAVAAVFDEAWAGAVEPSLEELLRAFADADAQLHAEGASPIPTKWYLTLQQAAARLARRPA